MAAFKMIPGKSDEAKSHSHRSGLRSFILPKYSVIHSQLNLYFSYSSITVLPISRDRDFEIHLASETEKSIFEQDFSLFPELFGKVDIFIEFSVLKNIRFHGFWDESPS